MQRYKIEPRKNLDSKMIELGFNFYKGYYDETAAYKFTSKEIDKIDIATAQIFNMCCQAVKYVIDNNMWKQFFIPEQYADIIRQSWEEDFCSFYGRMDLAVNEDCSSIKLLEFNADTPTSLYEASVIQWDWLKEYDPSADQFNSIHEKLLGHIGVCKEYLTGDQKLWFASLQASNEDYITTSYIMDLAHQNGIDVEDIDINCIGINKDNRFCNVDGRYIDNIFKLYPYEWMFNEDFGKYLDDRTTWIEPFYKSIMSNKMLLVILYQLFPNNPYILPTYYGHSNQMISYVKKPVYSREGSNVTVVEMGNVLQETSGEYGEEGYVYQKYAPLPFFDGNRPVIGSWVIGGETAGIGIKETDNYVHDNMSRFCSHYF